MFWCNIHDKEGNAIGEEETSRIKETIVTKAKIMRLAKVLQTMILVGGLEQAGEMIPFRMDLETVIAPVLTMWVAFSFPIVLVFMILVVGFFYLYKLYMDLCRTYNDLRGDFQRLREDHQQLSNETSMQHLYVTAMHVGLIRAGGHISLKEEITEQDWDNWHYAEKSNKREDDRHCRRELHRLKRVGRPRRHSTPGRSEEDDDLAPNDMSEGEY